MEQRACRSTVQPGDGPLHRLPPARVPNTSPAPTSTLKETDHDDTRDDNQAGEDRQRRARKAPNRQRCHNNVPLSIALLDGAKELKVLGNDAAHVIAKEYASIGREEAALSIEVAKEILKALYQHKGLVERLQKLRNAGPTP